MKLEVIRREPSEKKYHAPLLFVHGSCHGAWCWEENFLDFFAERGFSSHALSLRGHGGSDGKEKIRWTSVDDYVDDVNQIAGELPEKPVVIGHSLGGLVVQKYLERKAAPAAVLLAPSPSAGMLGNGFRLFWRYPILFTKVFLTFDVQQIYGTPARVRETLFSPTADMAKIENYTGRLNQESFRAFLETMFYLPQPKLVTTPMLVVGAENDLILTVASIRQTAEAYQADLKIFPDTAHDLMLEKNWRQVAEYIFAWLQKTLAK